MLKKLLANVGEYKKQSLQTPLFTMGEVLMDVIMPLIMAGLIDNGIEKVIQMRFCVMEACSFYVPCLH